MEMTITHQELHTTIRKELAPTRLDIHDIQNRLDSIEKISLTTDGRIDRLEILVEGLYVKFDQLETRFDNLERRFHSLEEKFNKLETRLNKLEARFDTLEQKLDKLISLVS